MEVRGAAGRRWEENTGEGRKAIKTNRRSRGQGGGDLREGQAGCPQLLYCIAEIMVGRTELVKPRERGAFSAREEQASLGREVDSGQCGKYYAMLF